MFLPEKFKQMTLKPYEAMNDVKGFVVIRYDCNFGEISYESKDYWRVSSYDKNGNKTSFEDSEGNWYKTVYNDDNNIASYEDSIGNWCKGKYDKYGFLINMITSDGKNWNF